MDRGSHMVKLWFQDHPGEGSLPTFSFRVLGNFKDCLTRQLKEAIRVQHRPDNLNSKGEFGGGSMPRMVVEKLEWERKVDMIENAKREEEENKKWEIFMVGRGNPSQFNESVMTKSDTKGPVYDDENYGNHTSTDEENRIREQNQHFH